MEAGKEVVKVRLSNIIPNRFQPRIAFDEEDLNELANSIKMYGVLQPLILRPIGDKYEIIAGERRYKASSLAGLTEVPAILVNLDDQTSAELAIIENIQRKDLTAIEEARSYKKLLDIGNLTQDQLAAKMGKKQSTIANKLRLLNLVPEAQDALLNNSISERHARSLLQIKDDPAKQREVLNKIMEGRLTVKETDELIKSVLNITPVSNNSTLNNENNSNYSNTLVNSQVSNNPVFPDNNDSININDISNPNMNISPNPNMYSNQVANNNETLSIGNEKLYQENNNAMEDQMNKTQVIDINAIREAAREENLNQSIPDFDSLLKVEEEPKEVIEEEPVAPMPKIGAPVSFGNKYFPSLEDEKANMTFGSAFGSINEETTDNLLLNQSDVIKQDELNKEETSTSSSNKFVKVINLARNFVSEVEKEGNNVISQEFDLSDEYQIIIRIKKEQNN